MKKTILGFGQVLWDLTANVDFQFLQDLDLEVGEHRLVTIDEINNLVKKINSNSENSIIKNSGGSSANVMSNLAKLGTSSAFCGKCGDDSDGKLYMKILNDEGVKTHSIIDNEKSTGQLLSLITPDKDRTFVVFWGASEFLPAELLEEKLIKSYDLVHMEGYLITNSYDALCKIFENAKETTFDLAAYSIINKTRSLLQKMMKKNNPLVLFSNLFEGKAFAQKEEPEDIIDEMLRYSENAILTLGEKGVLIKTSSGNTHFQEAIATNVVDTTGAGDAFCAGFLHEFLKTKDIKKAAKLGTEIASITISELGARSFSTKKLEIFRENNKN